MTNRELETRYMQMKLTWKNLVNANVELVDENKMLKEDIERLNNIINELEHHLYQEWLEWKDSDCESIYSRAGEDKAIYDYIQELKGNNNGVWVNNLLEVIKENNIEFGSDKE